MPTIIGPISPVLHEVYSRSNTSTLEEQGGLTDKAWFWPATAAVGTLMVGGLTYYFTRK
jgi:hypothetical protein